MKHLTARELGGYRTDPVAFIDRFVVRNELGRPFALLPFQRDVLRLAFTFDADGRLAYDTIVLAMIKKSGKTTINSALTTWWGFTQEAPNEILIAANDLEQSVGRVFKTCDGLLTHNPELRHSADIGSRVIRLSNDTTIQAIASEYAGAAGSNHGFTSWDELWGYVSERSVRLWEELTPVPTRLNSPRFISTYAGYEGESKLLRDLYLLGVGKDEHPDGQGERVHPTLPIYHNPDARTFIFWDHEPRMPWQTAQYYAVQRKNLRPTTYLRLHENRWSAGESAFITPELWDPCVDRARTPLLGDTDRALYVGVDAAQKHDTAAVVGVFREGDQIVLAAHRIWKPTPSDPLDLETTIEQHLRDLHARFCVKEIVADPWQMARSIATLKAAGLPIRELPQTTGNCTAFGQALFDALNGGNLRLYPADDLRQQALNTVAVESTRGWRIAKERTSKKIDAIVALAMAVLAAIEGGGIERLDLWCGPDTDTPIVPRQPPELSEFEKLVRRRGGWFPGDPM